MSEIHILEIDGAYHLYKIDREEETNQKIGVVFSGELSPRSVLSIVFDNDVLGFDVYWANPIEEYWADIEIVSEEKTRMKKYVKALTEKKQNNIPVPFSHMLPETPDSPVNYDITKITLPNPTFPGISLTKEFENTPRRETNNVDFIRGISVKEPEPYVDNVGIEDPRSAVFDTTVVTEQTSSFLKDVPINDKKNARETYHTGFNT